MAQLQGKARAEYVRGMFDRIATRYDLMNRLITGGQDRKWRRFAVQMAELPARGQLLDLATGTGDIALEMLQQQPTARVHGADFALEMMRVGRSRRGGNRIAWAGADALRLPYADACFDAVVSAYLLRNVIDIPQALAEQGRVLKPGGRIVILDTSPPPDTLLKPFINLHLKVGIPLLGRLVAGKAAADAYRYLPESTALFKTPQELSRLVEAAGFCDLRYRVFMLGTMAVHWGQKT